MPEKVSLSDSKFNFKSLTLTPLSSAAMAPSKKNQHQPPPPPENIILALPAPTPADRHQHQLHQQRILRRTPAPPTSPRPRVTPPFNQPDPTTIFMGDSTNPIPLLSSSSSPPSTGPREGPEPYRRPHRWVDYCPSTGDDDKSSSMDTDQMRFMYGVGSSDSEDQRSRSPSVLNLIEASSKPIIISDEEGSEDQRQKDKGKQKIQEEAGADTNGW